MTDISEKSTRQGRYRLICDANRFIIICADSPNIQLELKLGTTIAKGSLRKYPQQTIFLDGAYSGPPFMDHSKRRYSLDHHAGCVRAFTLAACEQAATMVFQGIPLGDGDWRIIVNDADLDSVLAGWILLNHAELARDEMKLLAEAVPFIKTEGNIDSMGLEASLLTGLPSDMLESERARVMKAAAFVKTPSGATKEQIAESVKMAMEQIDELLLPESLLNELSEYTELGRVQLAKGKTAILCRSAKGIYDVEAFYKSRYGSLLGIIVLTAGESRYTIRLVDGFLEGDMEALYRHLNKIDPAANKTADGENLWGGSSMIGGSPRQAGSELPPDRILEAIRKVYGQEISVFKRFFQRLARL